MTWASGLVERSGRLPEARRASADVGQRRPDIAPVCSGNQPREHIAWYRYITLVVVAPHAHLAFLTLQVTSAEDGAGWLAFLRGLVARGAAGHLRVSCRAGGLSLLRFGGHRRCGAQAAAAAS
ncbi:hypothetical protein C1J01_16230 [Nonomuraea aridisoli]|uniref:Uncharacterized protein n=1 Tax=Nonomuraea aridisoli TaxID=2070368 RepID=A0A2W2EZM9_9ACTN|nr:hypothetical protein C1J01_16230 [Nonomuraea aridisoli]